MSKIAKIVIIVCNILFCTGITIGLVGRVLCIRDTYNYQELQPELFAPDEIKTTIWDEDSNKLYVCYNDASYVNVYSGEGEFLWAVSTPYFRNTYFAIVSEQLVIYGRDVAYVYDAENGTFITKTDTESLDIEDWENEKVKDLEPNTFYFQTYEVIKTDENGVPSVFISRPWWYWIFNFGLCMTFSFINAAVLGICLFIQSHQRYSAARAKLEAKNKKPKCTNKKAKISNRKAAFVLKYYKVDTAISLVYAVADIIAGIFFDGILCIGIMPVALHFMISNAILYNIQESLSVSQEEKDILEHWKLRNIYSFIIAFFSVIIAVACTGTSV